MQDGANSSRWGSSPALRERGFLTECRRIKVHARVRDKRKVYYRRDNIPETEHNLPSEREVREAKRVREGK